MYLLKNTQFYNPQYSNIKSGVVGQALLYNDFYYSFTLFDKFTEWKELEVLEDQYSTEQIEELEKEIWYEFEKNCIPESEKTKTIYKLSAKPYSLATSS